MENSGKIILEKNDAPQWYVALGNRWVGPMTVADIYEKILSQQLSWAHYVWRQGQTEWKRICDVKAFQTAVPNEPGQGVQKAVKEATKPVVKKADGLRSSSKKNPFGSSKSGSKTKTGLKARARGTDPSQSERNAAAGARVSLQAEPKTWYLHYNDSQFGPFSQEEIQRFISIGKINGRVHAWQDGMKGWERIERLGIFQLPSPAKAGPPPFKGPGSPKPPKSGFAPLDDMPLHDDSEAADTDQRVTPRSPLVAKILMADEQSVITGVCRDISIGGLQVLTDKVPAKVGAKLKMNVSPSSTDSGGGDGRAPLEPFVAEGVVIRILEDGRGFSFRFKNLSDKAKRSIEAYIDSAS